MQNIVRSLLNVSKLIKLYASSIKVSATFSYVSDKILVYKPRNAFTIRFVIIYTMVKRFYLSNKKNRVKFQRKSIFFRVKTQQHEHKGMHLKVPYPLYMKRKVWIPVMEMRQKCTTELLVLKGHQIVYGLLNRSRCYVDFLYRSLSLSLLTSS